MAQSNLGQSNKFPSVQSIHSMVSLGYLPPGHGYIPKKIKPDKPYGPSYITTLNRTIRGPGRKCLRYALVAFCLAIFFYISAALYFAHRNVSRMIVRHSEPLGACLLIVAILLTSATFYFIYHARLASNRWRRYLRFHPDGLFHVQPVNDEYSPRDPTKLSTGTYGPRAVKEIPKPRYMKSRPGSRPGGRKRGPPMLTLQEGDEDVTVDEETEGIDGPQRFMADMPQVHKPSAVRPGQPEVMPPMSQALPVQKIVPLDRMPTQMRPTQEPFNPPGRLPSEGRITPGLDRMPPRQMSEPRLPPGMERMPPMMHHAPEPRQVPGSERMPAGGQHYTPEPRMAPGAGRQPPMQERMVPGSRPEPRMVPGQGRQTPEPRMAAGQGRAPPEPRMIPGQGRQTPEPRMIPGQGRQTPEPRMIPGQGRQAPEPRMIPGQGRQAPESRMIPGQGRQTPTPRMVPGSQGRPPAGKM